MYISLLPVILVWGRKESKAIPYSASGVRLGQRYALQSLVLDRAHVERPLEFQRGLSDLGVSKTQGP